MLLRLLLPPLPLLLRRSKNSSREAGATVALPAVSEGPTSGRAPRRGTSRSATRGTELLPLPLRLRRQRRRRRSASNKGPQTGAAAAASWRKQPRPLLLLLLPQTTQQPQQPQPQPTSEDAARPGDRSSSHRRATFPGSTSWPPPRWPPPPPPRSTPLGCCFTEQPLCPALCSCNRLPHRWRERGRRSRDFCCGCPWLSLRRRRRTLPLSPPAAERERGAVAPGKPPLGLPHLDRSSR